MKKKLALALALLMLGTSFITGCKKNENAGDENSDGNTQTEQNVEGASDFVAPEIVLTDYDKTNIIKVNDNEYSAALYRCMLYQVADYLGGDDRSVWEAAAEDELKYWNSLIEIFEDYGVTLSDSDYQQVYALRDQTIENFGGELEQYFEELDMFHMTEKVYIDRIAHYLYNEKFSAVFIEECKPEDQEILDYIHENYVRVKHILVKTEGLDDSQKAEARSRADRVLERAKAGESFEELVKEISEDGMDPELGYYFTYGTMVEPFEKASYELELDEISEIVESQFGYHIIKRYPMDDRYILEDEELRAGAVNYICNLLYSELVQKAIDEAKIEYLGSFEEINEEIINEYLASKKPATEEKAEEPKDDTAEESSETEADASEESAAA